MASKFEIFSFTENAIGGLKSHDIMVLLLLHNLPNRKKAVESLIKNKIRSGELTEELVKKCFKNHSTFIKSEFESVQAVAQILMTSTERALNQFSIVLFVQVRLLLNFRRYRISPSISRDLY